MLKKLLLSSIAVGAIAIASPANAVLTVSFFDVGTATSASCSDGAACDNGGQANQVVQINQIVGNFQIVGTFAASNSGSLQSSNLAIINNGAATDTLRMLVGNTSFAVPVSAINEAASLTFNDNVRAGPSTLRFYAGPANAQPSFGAPGGLLFSVSGTPTTPADAFSGTQITPFVSGSPFAMAEFAELNLLAGADITGFSMTMSSAVPEASTWAMLLLGFAGVGFMAVRKRRNNSAAFRLA